MKTIALLLILSVFVSCKGQTQDSVKTPSTPQVSSNTLKIDTTLYCLNLVPKGNYETVKRKGQEQIKILQKKYNQASTKDKKQQIITEAKNIFTEYIVNEIIPFWYGTPWTFSGHTDVPNEGTVACGYFVSTTLKHCGFNLNRYKFAQQASKIEAISINLSKDILIKRNISTKELKNYFLENREDGLYLVGLDFHVGYLLKRNGELFFIHSNYINKVGVVIEKAEKSSALASSKIFCIGNITNNDALMEKWILNQEIKVMSE